MKFRCERNDIQEAIAFASRALSNRATLPVLSGLRVEATEKGSVNVAATDLELTMETAFQAGVDEPGTVIVPGRLFGEMTRSLGAGQVSVVFTDGEVEISSGRGEFRVKALAPDDYPALPTEDRGAEARAELEVDCAEMAAALGQVVKAASTDDSRQVLTGVLWEIGATELTLAATDSYRLGVRTIAIAGGGTEVERVILPSRTLSELGRALQGVSGSMRASLKENLVAFTVTRLNENGEPAGEAVIGSRFIEGEFPNYRQLIPQGYANALTVDREVLLEVTKRVGLLAQNNLPVKLSLGSELEVSAHTPDVGEGQEVLDAEYEGEPLVIAFNPQFLNDGAAAVRTERLVLEAGDGLKPAILRGDGDPSFTYLLMPVRLS